MGGQNPQLPPSIQAASAASIEDVVGSFEAMRRYLREVKKCLERVDPFLGVCWEPKDVEIFFRR